MKTLKSNKGMTLVETIIGVALLAIASIMLVNGFVTTANIVTRATEYKIASADAAGAIELQEKTEDQNNLTLTNKSNSTIKFNITETATEVTINGGYINCLESETGLTYQEFISNNFDSFVDPDADVDAG